MKRQIMKGFAALCAGVMTLCATSFFVSCERLDVLDGQVANLEGEINDLQGQINKLDERLKAVEALKAQLEALADRIAALEAVSLKFQESSTTHELQYSLTGDNGPWLGTGIILAQEPTLKFRVNDNNELQYTFTDNGTEDWKTVTELAKNCEKVVKLQVNPETNELEIAMDGKTFEGTGIILAENCDNDFKFQVVEKEDGSKVVEFSYDGGKTWIPTGSTVVDPCTKPEVSFEETADAITVFVGDESFVITKPAEIMFEIYPKEMVLPYMGSQSASFYVDGIDDLTIIEVPQGWEAKIVVENYYGEEMQSLQVTAPGADDATAAKSGNVKIHAATVDGRCMVGKMPVSLSLSVAAYAENVYVEYNGYDSYFVGMSKKEDYESDLAVVLGYMKDLNTEALYSMKSIYSAYNEEDPFRAEWTVSELAESLGLVYDKTAEYVIWAIDSMIMPDGPFDSRAVASTTYASVNVDVTPGEATAYDVYVSVEVTGAKGYYATGVDETLLETLKTLLLEGFAGGQAPDSQYAKYHDANYEGYLSQINPMFPLEQNPESKLYLLVLPVDGRPWEAYSETDFIVKEYTTLALGSGSDLTITVTEGVIPEEEAWYMTKSLVLSASSENWQFMYWGWMTQDDMDGYADVIDDNDAFVARLIAANKEYAFNKLSKKEFTSEFTLNKYMPEYSHFVAFCVDNDNKYGKVLVVEL